MKLIIAGMGLMTLTSCVTPKLPETGIPTVYDGKWEGDFLSERVSCQGGTGIIEIRYGQILGEVFNRGRRVANVWGSVHPDGTLAAEIGKLGFSGASAEGKFGKNIAVGTWKRAGCSGEIKFKRI